MSPAPRLADLVESLRRHLARRVWWATLPWAGLAVAAVLVAAWLLAGSTGWAQGTRVPLALDAALVAALAAGAHAVRRTVRGRLSDPSLTRSMEDAGGLPPGSVLGTLELSRELPRGVSGSLAERAERGVLRDLEMPRDRLGGRLGQETAGWARRGWGAFAVLAPVVALLAVASPERAASAWKGLGSPVGLMVRPSLPPLDVSPGDVEVPRGADVRVVVRAPDRDSVTLRWQAAGDVVRTDRSPVVAGEAVFVVRDVRAPVRYGVTSPDGASAGSFSITPVDPLFVADVTVELAFPAHTGRTPEEYRGDLPPLTIPAGTRISFSGSASRELASGALLDSLGRPATELVVDGPVFRGAWRPTAGGVYRWSFRDREGGAAEITPQPLVLTVVPDSAPRVRFTFPARDTVLPLDLRQPLELEVRDDHGVGSLELVAYRVTSLGEREEPVVQALDLGGGAAARIRPLMDLSEWGLLPGDTVRYFARVEDNAPVPGTARTPEYALRMPGAAEMRRSAERQLDETAERIADLADRAARSEAETRNLERRSAAARDRADARTGPGERSEAGDPMGFEEREDLRRTLEEQAGMESEVDSLRRAMQAMAEALREAGLSDPGLRDDLDELQELLEQISSPEQRERLERMAEELEGMLGREAQEALQELLAEQEAFREQLERSLERFKRAAVEQDFRATTAEAEELARQESALADAFREGDDPGERAEQQRELEERAEGMEASMERLERRLQELGERDAAAEVREARQRSGESRQAMQRAGQEARQQEGERAGEQADRASEAMEEAAEELQEARQRMAQEQAAALEGALRQAAEDALALARRQSELREEMRGAGQERMAELRGDVAAVEQGVRNMAENLSMGPQGQSGARELSEQMGRSMEALRRTVEAMEGRAGPSRSPGAQAEEAVDGLNQLALMAMAGARQMAESGQAQGQAQGEGQVQQQLEDLAQQQGQLNNQAGQMMPMQLGAGALREQLERLAREQGSVADRLDEVSDKPGSEEEALGDLEALAEEARALARELAGGRLEAETRRRQERLFHRLLDAGRTLERDELDDERESEAPGAFRRSEVLPLGPEAMGALRYRLPDAAVLQRLTPAERRLVIRYFERLNRTGGGGGPEGGSGDGGSGGGT